jgi:protoporphyrin/coproporphyrin ferrochelatase
LEERLGVPVHLAMRYGNPSLRQAALRLQADAVDEVLVVPLYPQYASATTGSTLEAVHRELGRLPHVPSTRVVPPFFADSGFLAAWTRVLQDALHSTPGAHVVFSYHGLPERHVRATDQTGAHCLASQGCCDTLSQANHACYRAQCFATSRALKERLGLATASTAFQSRLGRTPWIGPPLDAHLDMLARQGVRRVAVACPSFVADCLETLEEVGLRMKARFEAAGGESLVLVPSLNETSAWLDALAALVRKELR